MVFSHSGFSDSEANGITMKNLLSAFSPRDAASSKISSMVQYSCAAANVITP